MSGEYKRLYFLHEGNDDLRFLREVVFPVFEERGYHVTPYAYSQKRRKSIKNLLRSVNSMGADYIYLADINAHPCITAKKSSVGEELEPLVDMSRVVVVVREIESWYLAGLDASGAGEIGVQSPHNTDSVTKEDFGRLQPARFESRIEFMTEVLVRFKKETAKSKNRSFLYFSDNYLS